MHLIYAVARAQARAGGDLANVEYGPGAAAREPDVTSSIFLLSCVHRMHLAEDAELYSMEDLIGVKKGSLLDLLEEVRKVTLSL